MVERDNTGKFKKGVSGNISGRPKTAALTQADRDRLVAIVQEHVSDKNLLADILTFLLERATLASEVDKYFEKYAPYLMPKLSQVSAKVQEIKEIVLRVEGFENLSIDTSNAKIIEGVIENEQHKEQSETTDKK